MTPCGAGIGDPSKRDRSALARDVSEGLVSAKGAKVYGG
jgi:N-methylhydantoinase B